MANDRITSSMPPKDRQPSKSNAGAKDTAPPPSPRSFNGFSEITSFIWSVADLLRGDYKQADSGKVILPLTVIRRLDCVLDKSKAKVKRFEILEPLLEPLASLLSLVTGVKRPLLLRGAPAMDRTGYKSRLSGAQAR
jgi:HsdM-like protein